MKPSDAIRAKMREAVDAGRVSESKDADPQHNVMHAAVYTACKAGYRAGKPGALLGCTDKELITKVFPDQHVPSIRWARFALSKAGYLITKRRRDGSKVWEANPDKTVVMKDEVQEKVVLLGRPQVTTLGILPVMCVFYVYDSKNGIDEHFAKTAESMGDNIGVLDLQNGECHALPKLTKVVKVKDKLYDV